MDDMESIRRGLTKAINAEATDREGLEQKYGSVWDTLELMNEFQVIAFCAPMVMVRQRETGKYGTLMFQDRPRFYFGFVEDASATAQSV